MMTAVVALLATTLAASTPHPDSRRGRLHELVRSVRETHGGPAYVSEPEIDEAFQRAERMLENVPEHDDAEANEEVFASACAHIMGSLRDPLASHLRPAQAVAARERFHGRASVGLKLHMCLVEKEDEVETAASSSVGRPWVLRWSWPIRRARWRRAALVSEVAAGSSAARAGIREGDELIEVGGERVEGRTRRHAIDMLEHGPEGSEVCVTTLAPHDNAKPSRRRKPAGRTVWLTRVATPPATVVGRSIANGRAHLVVISSFGATTATELRAELRAMRRRPADGVASEGSSALDGSGPSTLVFDLRGNEGGLLPEAVNAARMVLPTGRHVVSLGKESPLRVSKAYRVRWYHRCELPKQLRRACARQRGTMFLRPDVYGGGGSGSGVSGSAASGMPPPAALVVLVNGASASSAEVFAGALAHAGGAVVVGQRTYGKGSSQAVVYQRDGYAASFTAYTLTMGRRSGRVLLDGVGVRPHVEWRWRAPRGMSRVADDAEVERVLSALGCCES